MDLMKVAANYVTEPTTEHGKIEITEVTLSPQYKNQLMGNKDKINRLVESYGSNISGSKSKNATLPSHISTVLAQASRDSTLSNQENYNATPRGFQMKSASPQDPPEWSTLVY